MANEAHSAELAIIISYPTSASGIIILFFVIFLDFHSTE